MTRRRRPGRSCPCRSSKAVSGSRFQQVACVEMDGGRLQIRNRKPSEEESQRTKQAGFWREDKVGCLLSMTSAVSEEDPCPQIPQAFVDRERMRKISREIKGFCVPDEEASASSRGGIAIAARATGGVGAERGR